MTAQIETFAQEKINYSIYTLKREKRLSDTFNDSNWTLFFLFTHSDIVICLFTVGSEVDPFFCLKHRRLDTPETGLWVSGTDNEIEFRRTLKKESY